MNVGGTSYRTIWPDADRGGVVHIIDQRLLPHRFEMIELRTMEDARAAITDMAVRGAPLIGCTAAYGMYLAAYHGNDLDAARLALAGARPTAVNLAWALSMQERIIRGNPPDVVDALRLEAERIADEDVANNHALGMHGLEVFASLRRTAPERALQVLTHCNAGWLATVDWGTATAPIYLAHNDGIPIHVWVDETRPRNQGANLTAWELGEHGVPHTVITDNAGGHLMQHGKVDVVITGTDRTTRTGDVCNKIGTYLKALAARDNDIPFYVALPSATVDWAMTDGVAEIPIEERSPDEVTQISGWDGESIRSVRLTPAGSPAANYGFDVTPARLVTGLITERGICSASEEGLAALFPEAA
jgi:methylthioribose-1-phosphate isomerase